MNDHPRLACLPSDVPSTRRVMIRFVPVHRSSFSCNSRWSEQKFCLGPAWNLQEPKRMTKFLHQFLKLDIENNVIRKGKRRKSFPDLRDNLPTNGWRIYKLHFFFVKWSKSFLSFWFSGWTLLTYTCIIHYLSEKFTVEPSLTNTALNAWRFPFPVSSNWKFETIWTRINLQIDKFSL